MPRWRKVAQAEPTMATIRIGKPKGKSKLAKKGWCKVRATAAKTRTENPAIAAAPQAQGLPL
jgi:hypothetical protein